MVRKSAMLTTRGEETEWADEDIPFKPSLEFRKADRWYHW